MSKFTNNLKAKLSNIRKLTYDMDTEEMLNDLIGWVNAEEGTDLEDALSDFDEADIKEYLTTYKRPNIVMVEVPNITAESELQEVLEKFKNKYGLTEIY